MRTQVKPLLSFSEIIGQEKPKKILRQTISREKIPHAYLFTGIPGVGKLSMARILAMVLNCHKLNDKEICGECKPCRTMKSGNYPYTEFIILRPKKKDVSIFDEDDSKDKESAALSIRIEHIRELEQKLMFAPLEKYRVCVIDPAEKMTAPAANAFLKTLEEPPHGNVLILKTENSLNLLPTILSRCQRIAFQPLHVQEMTDWFMKNRNLGKDKGMLLAKLSSGSLGRAIKIKEKNGFQ
jgi:DNA polymerase-3 subunit delta'